MDFLEEMRNESQSRLAVYQKKLTRYYNLKVKKKAFCMNDLVLQMVFLSTKEPRV